MRCPYCGFKHLERQSRCVRCRKPLDDVPISENSLTGEISSLEAGPEDSGASHGDDSLLMGALAGSDSTGELPLEREDNGGIGEATGQIIAALEAETDELDPIEDERSDTGSTDFPKDLVIEAEGAPMAENPWKDEPEEATSSLLAELEQILAEETDPHGEPVAEEPAPAEVSPSEPEQEEPEPVEAAPPEPEPEEEPEETGDKDITVTVAEAGYFSESEVSAAPVSAPIEEPEEDAGLQAQEPALDESDPPEMDEESFEDSAELSEPALPEAQADDTRPTEWEASLSRVREPETEEDDSPITYSPHRDPEDSKWEESGFDNFNFKREESVEDDEGDESLIEIKPRDDSFEEAPESRLLPFSGEDSGSGSWSGRGVRPVSAASRRERPAGAAGLLVRRAGAGVIDFAVWLTLGVLLFKASSALVGAGELRGSAAEWLSFVVVPLAAMTFILALVYGGLFGSVIGRTPGMLLFGLRLADGQGGRPRLGQSFLNSALFIASLAPLGAGLLIGMGGLFPEGLHCRFSGVRVERA